MLASLGQEHGFPVPEGGSGKLTEALVRRLESRGGAVVCDTPVTGIEVRGRRAVAVRTAGGDEIGRDAARCSPTWVRPRSTAGSCAPSTCPARILEGMKQFQYDHGTFKVDWALDGPVPWTAPAARRAGTVHLADSMDHLSEVAMQLATDRIPARPFCLVGQMTTTDPTRSPPGTETLWAYTHVPRDVRGDAGGDLTGKWDERENNAFADRIEARDRGARTRLPRSHHRRPASCAARRCSRPPTPTSWAGR